MKSSKIVKSKILNLNKFFIAIFFLLFLAVISFSVAYFSVNNVDKFLSSKTICSNIFSNVDSKEDSIKYILDNVISEKADINSSDINSNFKWIGSNSINVSCTNTKEEIIGNKEKRLDFSNGVVAYITIPSLGIYDICVKEGVSDDVINSYIGHFENTSVDEGNICLAAHNRSNTVSYFSKLNMLSNGEKIILKLNGKTREYAVSFFKEIDSYNWEYLQNTEKNCLTLITCISNRPKMRLCVRANEIL